MQTETPSVTMNELPSNPQLINEIKRLKSFVMFAILFIFNAIAMNTPFLVVIPIITAIFLVLVSLLIVRTIFALKKIDARKYNLINESTLETISNVVSVPPPGVSGHMARAGLGECGEHPTPRQKPWRGSTDPPDFLPLLQPPLEPISTNNSSDNNPIVFTLKMRIKWQFTLTILILLLACATPDIIHISSMGGIFAGTGIYLFSMVIIMLMIYALIFFLQKPSEWFCITENYIKVHAETLKFDNTLLFVCYASSGISNQPYWYYELINARKSIAWSCMRKEPDPFMPLHPLVSFSSPLQKTNDFIEYISLKTDLPLYDLSGPDSIQIYPPLESGQEIYASDQKQI